MLIRLLADDAETTPHDTPVNIPVLENDGPDLTVHSIVIQPTNGNATILPDGTVTYTPDHGFEGVDVFNYKVCNPVTNQCTEATVTVAVDPPLLRVQSPAASEFVQTGIDTSFLEGSC